MFLPSTQRELRQLGWDFLDMILISGDAYLDSPMTGIAVIGKTLIAAGYKVGVIAQPDLQDITDISRLGEPRLFWGVSAGCVDSMVANYTATGRKRKGDDFTPGGLNTRRPDRASIVYANLIRRAFKRTVPIVLGGIEASLRRIAHYDFWSDRIRKSILVDAKADYLLYGMADQSVLDLAKALKEDRDVSPIRGLCYLSRDCPASAIDVPDYPSVCASKAAFIEMFHAFYAHNNPAVTRPLVQQQDTRYLVQNPPAVPLNERQLDISAGLDFERNIHPFDLKKGPVKAMDTIRFSITTHRGCYGECNFCAIAVHQGRSVHSRSTESIIKEARLLTQHPAFKGTLQDVGGPTANMYAIACNRRDTTACKRRCLYPSPCPRLPNNHTPQIRLLRAIAKIKGVKHVFVASGVRHDLVMADTRAGKQYIKTLASQHVSGQMKLAPEHADATVLAAMGKPSTESLLAFKSEFEEQTRQAAKKQFLTYYFIAAHPGCSDGEMTTLKAFASQKLKLRPEQVQVFTPTPSTYSTLMYATGINPFTGAPIFVEKSISGKTRQKKSLTGSPNKTRPRHPRKMRTRHRARKEHS